VFERARLTLSGIRRSSENGESADQNCSTLTTPPASDLQKNYVYKCVANLQAVKDRAVNVVQRRFNLNVLSHILLSNGSFQD
jgi:hypothetical protein